MPMCEGCRKMPHGPMDCAGKNQCFCQHRMNPKRYAYTAESGWYVIPEPLSDSATAVTQTDEF